MSNSRSRYSSHSRSPYWDRSSCLSSISRSRSRSSFRSHESSDVENPGHNLYVTGLSPRVTKRDLEKHFSSEGTVVDIHLVLDPWTRESRGFGFVAMATVKDANRCLKYLDQSVLKGRKIMVEKARRCRGRTPTPGRYLGLKSARVRHRSPSYSPPRGRTSNSPAYYYGRDRSYSPCYRRYRSRSRSSDRSYSPYNRGVHASSRYYREDRSHSPYYRRYRSRSRSCSYTPCRRRRYNLSRHYSRRDLSYSPSNRRYRSPSRSLSPPHYSRSHAGRRRERSCSSHSVSESYSQSPTPHYHCSRRYRSISPSMSPRGEETGGGAAPGVIPPGGSGGVTQGVILPGSGGRRATTAVPHLGQGVSLTASLQLGTITLVEEAGLVMHVSATLARFHHLGDPSLLQGNELNDTEGYTLDPSLLPSFSHFFITQD